MPQSGLRHCSGASREPARGRRQRPKGPTWRQPGPLSQADRSLPRGASRRRIPSSQCRRQAHEGARAGCRKVQETQRYGSWIEIRKETAHAHLDLLAWCRRHCNSELPAGGFRFAPKVWKERSDEPLSVPFLPKFDHPSPAIRELAAAERQGDEPRTTCELLGNGAMSSSERPARRDTAAGSSAPCWGSHSAGYSS